MAVKGRQNSLDNTTNKTQKTVNHNVDDHLQAVDDEDDLGENANANEASDAAAQLAYNVDIVGAALGAVGDAVEVALANAELASEVLDDVEKTQAQASLNVGLDNGETKNVRVESNHGINDAFEVETRQSGTHFLKCNTDVGIDVDFHPGGELERDSDVSEEDESERASLAPLMLFVVRDDFVGRGSTESAKLDVD